jgi:hypothetical protein
LGSSEGEFAPTNFSSNVADILSAVDYLSDHYRARSLLIGYSIGGAAVRDGQGCSQGARHRHDRRASRCRHVLKNFGTSLKEIEVSGSGHLNVGSFNPC